MPAAGPACSARTVPTLTLPVALVLVSCGSKVVLTAWAAVSHATTPLRSYGVVVLDCTCAKLPPASRVLPTWVTA